MITFKRYIQWVNEVYK